MKPILGSMLADLIVVALLGALLSFGGILHREYYQLAYIPLFVGIPAVITFAYVRYWGLFTGNEAPTPNYLWTFSIAGLGFCLAGCGMTLALLGQTAMSVMMWALCGFFVGWYGFRLTKAANNWTAADLFYTA